MVRDESGLATGFETEGDFPKYGNDDDRADEIGVWLLRTFLEMIKKRHTYRNSEATTSILTITSNVVYGKYTGALPDGRAAFTPFAPGANPSYGAEQNGLLASLNSVAKLPYHWALDGISNTQTINPDALGHSEGERVENLVQVMDGYFDQGAHHLSLIHISFQGGAGTVCAADVQQLCRGPGPELYRGQRSGGTGSGADGKGHAGRAGKGCPGCAVRK